MLRDEREQARIANEAKSEFLAKIDDGKLSLFPKPCVIGGLIEAVKAEFDLMCQQKGISLEIICDASLYAQGRMVDDTRFTQILRNLVSNAVKFTDQGGVTIEAKVGDQPDRVIIAVKDTGLGVPPEHQAKIFNAFEQIHRNDNRTKQGTGLGLAITSELVHMMDGFVTLESREGLGSTFFVDISPSVTELPTSVDDDPKDWHIPSARILLAEDVDMNRDIFKALLSHYPLQIDETENGKAAFEAATKKAYDLIFMDIEMPEMNGLQALHALQRQEVQPPKSD